MKSAPADPGAFGANLVAFGRLLRRAGLVVDPGQTRLFARVLPLVGVDRRRDVKAAARAVYVRRREDLALFDAAFDLFWRRATVQGAADAALPRLSQRVPRGADPMPGAVAAPEAGGPDAAAAAAGASRHETLRRADFGELTPAEADDALALLELLGPGLPQRRSRRYQLARSGARLASRALLRGSLATGGEALDWQWLLRRTRPRPLVLICDISGSMATYSRLFVRFAHALGGLGAPVEVFAFGTRLTRITRELRVREAGAALRRVADRVVDWHGGTRIAASLHELRRRWLSRTVRGDAIVMLASDGWERDDPARLAAEMAALRRRCHRLLWLDPLAARAGFEPATAGLRAALPFVDELVPCASVASLEALADRLGRLSPTARGRRARPPARLRAPE
jgi:uncharacterized protein with von Willebrand factor type A (vWA) domain